MQERTTASQELPAVACTLESTDFEARLSRWKRLYADAGTGRIETDDGVRVSFRRDAGVERELRALAELERECCGWAAWAVETVADELVLAVRSSGEGIRVIRGWFLAQARGVSSST